MILWFYEIVNKQHKIFIKLVIRNMIILMTIKILFCFLNAHILASIVFYGKEFHSPIRNAFPFLSSVIYFLQFQLSCLFPKYLLCLPCLPAKINNSGLLPFSVLEIFLPCCTCFHQYLDPSRTVFVKEWAVLQMGWVHHSRWVYSH